MGASSLAVAQQVDAPNVMATHTGQLVPVTYVTPETYRSTANGPVNYNSGVSPLGPGAQSGQNSATTNFMGILARRTVDSEANRFCNNNNGCQGVVKAAPAPPLPKFQLP